MNLKKHIGKTITNLRKEKNITQRDLAKQIGYSPSTMSQLESGQFQIPIDTLNKIAQLFKVPISYFFPKNDYIKSAYQINTLEKKVSELTNILHNQLLNINRKQLYVSITGNINIGKRKITKHLVEEFTGQALHENEKNNPFLDKFYRNPSRWGFMSQLYFLTQNFYQQSKIKNYPGNIFQGRTLWDNYNVFAKLFRELGYISNSEFYILKRFYEGAQDVIKVPDLIIYIETPIKQIIQQSWSTDSIKTDPQYLEQIQEQYKSWIKKVKICPVKTLQFNNKMNLQKIINIISKLHEN